MVWCNPSRSDAGREVKAARLALHYLRAFYEDESRPYGVNNRVYPNVVCPMSDGIARLGCLR